MDEYYLKNINYFGRDLKILLQGQNGPCPLLAIANVLIIRGTLVINPEL